MTQKVINIVLALGLVVVGVFAFTSTQTHDSQLGGASFYEAYPIHFGGGLKIGAKGSTYSKFIKGTCNPTTYATLAATSSTVASCAVTDAVSGDNVNITLPPGASAGSVQGGLLAGGAAASTTDGYIYFYYVNQSGQATTSYPLATTSVYYEVKR